MVTEAIQQNEDDTITREYECGYLLVPSIPNEKISEETQQIKKTLTDHGAVIANEQDPKRFELAYTMTISREGKREKYTEASFGWITFEATTDQVNSMKEEISRNESVLRFMIIKANKDQEPEVDEEEQDNLVNNNDDNVDENEGKSTPASEVEADADTDLTEIDKGIDELVVEEKSTTSKE